MNSIDFNCDMGEGMMMDASVMPYISSANIACGYHAGDVATIQKTIELCLKYNVAIGAHPSFNDRENFGRTEMNLPAAEIYELVTQQLFLLNEVADSFDIKVNHVKPHGALYNMSAKNKAIAGVIARAVSDFDHELVLFGLSGSHSVHEAKAAGLRTANEVFADRSYGDDGKLTPRTEEGALITDVGKTIVQVLQMIKQGTVTSLNGKIIHVVADTICIHGDGEQATEFAKAIHEALDKEGIKIKPV